MKDNIWVLQDIRQLLEEGLQEGGKGIPYEHSVQKISVHPELLRFIFILL